MLTYDYITDFAWVTEVHVPGHQHQMETRQLQVDVLVPHHDGSLVPYPLYWWYRIHPITFDVHIFLMTNRHAGVVLLTRQPSR